MLDQYDRAPAKFLEPVDLDIPVAHFVQVVGIQFFLAGFLLFLANQFLVFSINEEVSVFDVSNVNGGSFS